MTARYGDRVAANLAASVCTAAYPALHVLSSLGWGGRRRDGRPRPAAGFGPRGYVTMPASATTMWVLATRRSMSADAIVRGRHAEHWRRAQAPGSVHPPTRYAGGTRYQCPADDHVLDETCGRHSLRRLRDLGGQILFGCGLRPNTSCTAWKRSSRRPTSGAIRSPIA